jgi:chromosome segregation ATPase
VASLSEALDAVAGMRDRLERETAEMADRGSAQLTALDEAISRVRAERDRTWIAVEDERVRLSRLELDAARVDADHAAHARRAAHLAGQIEAQRQVLDALADDAARARDAAFAAAAAHVQSRLRIGAARRALRAQLEQSRAEIARASAAHASAAAALEAASATPAAAVHLGEIATRRERLEAELAQARRERGAIAGPREPDSLADRMWLERAAVIDAEIARLGRDRDALDAAEADARRELAAHEATLQSLRREVEIERSRLLATHRRFTLLEESMEEDDARLLRDVAEAEAASVGAANLLRALEAALPAEGVRLEELRRELGVVESSAAAAAGRRDALQREIAEELRLRTLMRELATLELSLAAAQGEREELERLVGRMRAAAL